jgi:hypothetical protein
MKIRKMLCHATLGFFCLLPALAHGQWGSIPGSSMETYLGVSKENPVQLIDASMISKYIYHATSESTFIFNAMVENLADGKKVAAVITMSDDSVIEIPMVFKEKVTESKAIWTSQSKYYTSMSGNTGINLAHGKKFYIKYEVGGRVFVDNNGEKFYQIKGSDSLILNPQINIRVDCRSSNPDDPSTCKSVEFATRVLPNAETSKVYFTKNNWNNLFIITDANEWYTTKYFYPNRWPAEPSHDDSLKAWRLQFESEILNAHAAANDTIKFVVSYQVNGKTYYDTNFGRGYTLAR